MTMSIPAWIEERRTALRPEVRPLPWALNREWRFEGGVLRHRASRYFSVIGACIDAPGARFHGTETVMIDQPEVGLLGFVVSARADGFAWLLQAKSEPGSVDFVQVGPTVQATRSNYCRVHGGAPTQFLDLFQEDGAEALADSLQSEQGSKFLGKFNRNALRLVREPFASRHASFCWFAADDLRSALAHDFLVNTDARSSIVCAPWRFIGGGRPLFSSAPAVPESEFVRALGASYRAGTASTDRLVARLREAEAGGGMRIKQLPLDKLENWTIGDTTIRSKDRSADIEVASYDISAPGREVEHWQQPLLRGLKEHRAGLVFQSRAGRLKVFLRVCVEPGFGGRQEYGPSFQSDGLNPRWIDEIIVECAHPPMMAIRQSDEGGRFMQAVMRYELHIISEDIAVAESDGGEWVDIAELEALCRSPRVTTNEARSAVSLLLSLA